MLTHSARAAVEPSTSASALGKAVRLVWRPPSARAPVTERPMTRGAAARVGTWTAARAASFSTTRLLMLMVPRSLRPGRTSGGASVNVGIAGHRLLRQRDIRGDMGVAIQHLGDDKRRRQTWPTMTLPEAAERSNPQPLATPTKIPRAVRVMSSHLHRFCGRCSRVGHVSDNDVDPARAARGARTTRTWRASSAAGTPDWLQTETRRGPGQTGTHGRGARRPQARVRAQPVDGRAAPSSIGHSIQIDALRHSCRRGRQCRGGPGHDTRDDESCC